MIKTSIVKASYDTDSGYRATYEELPVSVDIYICAIAGIIIDASLSPTISGCVAAANFSLDGMGFEPVNYQNVQKGIARAETSLKSVSYDCVCDQIGGRGDAYGNSIGVKFQKLRMPVKQLFGL